MRYKAYIRAAKGTLLGGVKEHRSIPFDTLAEAQNWLDVCVKTNKEAGRKLSEYGVVVASPKVRINP